MNPLNSFLNSRSKREIFLFKLLWICGCFFVCFEYFIYPSFLNHQIYENSKNLQSPYDAQEIEDFLTHFNTTSLSPSKIQEEIERSAQSLIESKQDFQDSSPTLSFKGVIQSDKFFSLLYTLSSPSLFISSLSLDAQGNFSLTLKTQKITALSPITPLTATPKDILSRFSHLTSPLTPLLFYTPPKPKISLTLEAIFNQKAKINGTWITKQESIQGYTLQEVHPHFILLTKDSQTLKLHLKEKRIFQ